MTTDDDFEFSGPSKSQLKRDADARQKVGESFISFEESVLVQLELTDTLLDAVLLAKKMKNNGSLKRQKQLIGKLMRMYEEDEYQAIITKLEFFNSGSAAQKQLEHKVEKIVLRVLENDPTIFDELMALNYEFDIQHIRQLSRNAQKDIAKGVKSKHRTELFRYIRRYLQDSEV